MSVQISIKKTEQSRLNSFNPEKIEFGKVFSDHMLICDYKNGQWQEPYIIPYGEIELSPALSAIHYGQSIFEGLKAYKNQDDIVTLFRPEQNAKRLNRSAQRMCMPDFPEDLFLECLETIVDLERDWIPTTPGSSLYLRPFMFATDEFLGIKPSEKYKFMIYCCPVGSYYSAPVKVFIDKHYVRAVRGGVGAAKCAGNYAASLYPAKLAREKGFDQILWTDAIEHKYLEETGTSNIFVKCGNDVHTPPLSDSILPGITRDTVITHLKDLGYNVIEQNIAISDLVSWHENGLIDEMFVSGTAATVINIQLFGLEEKIYKLNLDKELLAEKIKTDFENIKFLKTKDKHGWVKVVSNTIPLEIN
jgi:branched-chain amino acid aminotransferase